MTDQQHVAIGRIQRSQRHLLGLINDVLNFAKLEAGHVAYDLTDVSLDEALAALEPLVAPQLRAKTLCYHAGRVRRRSRRARRRRQAPPDPRQPALERHQVHGRGGRGDAPLRGAGRRRRARSRDGHGIGIASDAPREVFAPFVQIDRRLNTPHEGTGLGLAISRDLARGMGAT
jgi:signal transduction histidine kinase